MDHVEESNLGLNNLYTLLVYATTAPTWNVSTNQSDCTYMSDSLPTTRLIQSLSPPAEIIWYGL